MVHRDYREAPGYIYGLDGMRALAIGGVLVYHLTDRFLPGGFLGVDVFFVVSGFLITTLLLREKAKKGRIALADFWLRRARRLLPGLVTVVLCVVSVTRLAALVSDDALDLLVHIDRQVLGTLTFSNNWLEIAAGSDYFAGATPLLFVNFWSLAVEEQFYVFWPLVVTALLAIVPWRGARVVLVLGIAVASALAMALLYDPDAATRVYYGTDTHLFGLMLGAALAFAWAAPGGGPAATPAFRRLAPMIGIGALLGVLVLMVVLRESLPFTFRGGILLTSLLTALLIASLIAGPSPLRAVMDSRPLAWIGERSYGIYMWHWPVILLVGIWFPGHGLGRDLAVALVAVPFTLAVSEVSFRFVEQPVRRRGFRGFLSYLREARSPRPPWQLPAIGLAVLVVVTGVTVATAPAASRAEQQIRAGEEVSERRVAEAIEVARGQPEVGDGLEPGDHSAPAGHEIIAIGDSQIAVLGDLLTSRVPGILPDGRSNRKWPDGESAVRSALDQGIMRRGVILAFGTNGGTDTEILTRVLDLLGPDRVVVVMNLYNHRVDWIPAANRMIEEVVTGRRNVAIGRWYEHAAAHPEQIQPDGFHPNLEGVPAYVDLAMAGFDEIAAR